MLPWPRDFNALIYVLAGSGTVGEEQRPIQSGQLAALGAGDVITATAGHTPGEPPPQPRPADPRRAADP